MFINLIEQKSTERTGNVKDNTNVSKGINFITQLRPRYRWSMHQPVSLDTFTMWNLYRSAKSMPFELFVYKLTC